jgi:LPPG:FO 2-phospho-L-lactate transferase
MKKDINFVALAGGVGGAKMADGLAQVLQPEQLTIIVNTGDDFVHLGLRISPDLDTVCYTLAGMVNLGTGWGRNNETWTVMDGIRRMGMPDWFQIGDTDLVTHLTRTVWFNEGWTLSRITEEFCQRWGISIRVLPMTDQFVQTIVITPEGELNFQEYFVHQKCMPVVTGFRFNGVEKAIPAPGVLEAIHNADIVFICPSNPWVSIDPILAIPGLRGALIGHSVIAVSPIIGSQTIKGPAAKMFTEMGIHPSALAVAQHYYGLVDCIVIDRTDLSLAGKINELGIETFGTDILMRDGQDRGRLVKEIINYLNTKTEVI